MSESVEESIDTKPLNYRLIGFGVLVTGCLLLLGFIGWPIYQAHAENTEITIFKKFIAAGLFAVVVGVNGIIFGEAAFSWIPSGDTNLSDIKLTAWLMIVANLAILFFVFYLLENYLKSLGYDTSQF